MRDILLILMEGQAAMNLILFSLNPSDRLMFHLSFVSLSGTPSGVKYSEVLDRLLAVKGVTAVHNLHIWALTMNQAVLSAHVAIGGKENVIQPKCFKLPGNLLQKVAKH